MARKVVHIARIILPYVCAFCIPCIIILVVFYYYGMYPFGEYNIIEWDLRITYTYFYEWYRSLLQGDGSLFYSFSKSLGGNMFAGWSCLLCSPLCLFIVFFGDNPVNFLTFMMIVKFGLAGMSSLFYLRARFHLHPALSLCLSLGYSMMLFMTSQATNIMWLDAVIMLPFVMYGIYCLVHRGKVVFFAVCLFLCIVFNFYNGYMICLFSVLFYLFESYLAVPTAKRIRLRFLVFPGRFSIAYTLAISASSALLLPTALALLAGKGAVPSGFFTLATRFDFYDVPRSVFLGVFEPGYLPQLYCGTLALIALVWFFINERIAKREKLAAAVFISIMILSVWLVMGDRIWLGLRDGNACYCRFTFLISGLFIFLAARSLKTMEAADKKKLITAAIIVAVFAAVIFFDNYFPHICYFVAIFLLCVTLPLGIIFLSKTNKPLFKTILSLLLVFAVSCEALLSWTHVEGYSFSTDSNNSYQRYGRYFEEGKRLVTSLKETDDVQAYRMEKTFNFLSPMFRIAQNDSLAFGFNGVALYDSAYDRRVQQILYHLGYTPNIEVRITYSDSMLVSDSILGIKYVIDRSCPQGFQKSTVTEVWDEHKVYENPYALPLGFKSSEMILTDINYTGNPFEYQNEFLSALNGKREQFLVPIKPTLSASDDEIISWTFEAPDNAILFGYIESDGFYSLDLYDGEINPYVYLDWWSQGIFPIESPSFTGMHSISLKGEIPESISGIKLHVAYLDLSLFESTIKQLKTHPFEINVFEDGHVHGSYYAEQNELLFTSIPYDPGWTIKVNGTKIVPLIAQDTFIIIEVGQGVNEIEMNYLPPGLVPGLVVSVSSIALFAAFIWHIYRRPTSSIHVEKNKQVISKED